MFKVLYWLLLDSFFIYVTVDTWGELRGYKILLIAFVTFFTWELFSSIKKLIEK